MKMDLGEGLHELVRGKIVAYPYGTHLHGYVCAQITCALGGYERQFETGYTLCNGVALWTEREPDTVRGVDVSFYTHARWPITEGDEEIPTIPPDLAVEVAESGEARSTILARLHEYLNAGSPLAWAVYPKGRLVLIFRPHDACPMVLTEADVIADLPELPGFRCPVADFFPPRA